MESFYREVLETTKRLADEAAKRRTTGKDMQNIRASAIAEIDDLTSKAADFGLQSLVQDIQPLRTYIESADQMDTAQAETLLKGRLQGLMSGGEDDAQG